MKRARRAIIVYWLSLSTLIFSQTSVTAFPATVSFTLDFPQSTPDHYSIVVDSSGKANYTSGTAKAATEANSDGDTTSDSAQPYHYSFTVSPATRDHIFDLAARANYFSGDVNYKKHNIASTGEKTLAYKDDHRNTQAHYNYSTNPAVQELTSLFQRLSATLEYGRHLDEAFHYQKLALDEQLKSMEQQADQNGLLEIQAVAPILKKIADNPSVINVTRARAQRLLAKAATTASSPQ